MAQSQERPGITEIQVRVDCNGCVQKIKKALRGINGISDVYINLPRQKLTIIVGWADPERIIKAVKKARKNATIYSHSEVQEQPPAQPSDPAPPDGEAPPPPENSNSQGEESHPPQPESPKDQPPQTTQPPSKPPKDHPPPENPALPAENPTPHEPPPPPVEPNEAQHQQHSEAEEVHVIHHHPPDHSYRNRSGYGPPGYTSGPPDYNRAYNRGPEYSQGYGPNYSPEHPSYSQRYGPSYNPGPPGYSQGNSPSYGSGPNGYRRGYTEPGYNLGPPDHSQGYEPSYNPEPPGHSRSHGYGNDWSGRPEPSYRPERPQPIQVTHSYNQYRPAPNVTQYRYVQSPPRYTPYARMENVQSPPYASAESYYYNDGDYQSNDNSNGYMASMLSEENPNACTIS